MKNELNFRIKLLYLFTVLLFTFSCSDENLDSNEDLTENSISSKQPDPDDPVVKILLGKGWNLEQITKLSNGKYLVAGDIVLSGDINDYDTTQSKQHVVRTLLNKNVYKNITIFLDRSLTQVNNTNFPNEDNWTDAFTNAIRIWNSVRTSGLRFKRVFSKRNADIVVRSDRGTLPNLVVASADFPVQSGANKGKPGGEILINTNYANNLSMRYEVKLNNMVHEMGHAIGFRHTNWRAQNEPNDSFGYFNVPGTTSSGNNPDPNSVMNGGTGDDGFRGLSVNDKKAIKYWYPN